MRNKMSGINIFEEEIVLQSLLNEIEQQGKCNIYILIYK